MRQSDNGVYQIVVSQPHTVRGITPQDIYGPEGEFLYGDSEFGESTPAGIKVTTKTAMLNAAWYRGCSIVSETVAKTPIDVSKSKDRSEFHEHPAYRILSVSPNDYMTPFNFKRLIMYHAVHFGGGFAAIYRPDSVTPAEVHPLDPRPDYTYPIKTNGGRVFYITHLEIDGQMVRQPPIPAEDIIHIRGIGLEALVGFVTKTYARESIGWGLAIDRFGARFFNNAARPNVILEAPPHFTEDDQRKLKDSFERLHKGGDNAHRTALIPNGTKTTMVSINARDAQLMEAADFTAREIALFLGVPPHKLGVRTNQGYGSLEQSNQEWLDEGLDHWLVNCEQEFSAKLLTSKECDKQSVTISFNRLALTQADAAGRSTYYSAALNTGCWMAPNEVRKRDGLPPVEGGDELRTPLNMTTGKPANVPGGTYNSVLATAKAVSVGEITKDAAKVVLAQGFTRFSQADIDKFVDALEEPADPVLPADQSEIQAIEGGKPAENPPKTAEKPAETPIPATNPAITRAAGEILEHSVKLMIERVNKHALRVSKDRRKFGEFIESIDAEHREVFQRALRPVQELCRAMGNHGDAMLDDWLLRAVRDHWNAAADQFTPAELPAAAAEFGDALIADATRAARDLFLDWEQRGGPGSGPQGGPHPKTPAGKGPTQPKLSDRAERAKASHNPSTKEKQDLSEHFEHTAVAALGGVKSSDNKPMDVKMTVGKQEVGIELKMMHDAKDQRVNMRPDSRIRKEAWAAGHSEADIKAADARIKAGKEAGKKVDFHIPNKPKESPRPVFIVANDARDSFQAGAHKGNFSGHNLYVAQKLGAVALSSMVKVGSLKEAKDHIERETKKWKSS